MSVVSVDPARLARYRSVGDRLDHDLHAVAASLDAAAEQASVSFASDPSGGEARHAVQVAAARDLADRIDALWRDEVRTTQWVGAVARLSCAEAREADLAALARSVR